MSRLPQPGGDEGNWGDILNDYLSQAHEADGSLKTNSITAAQLAPGSVHDAALANETITSQKLAANSVTNVQLDDATKASLAKADSSVQPGDLGSAATASTSDFAQATHSHTASQISDTTTVGRGVMTATDENAAAVALGTVRVVASSTAPADTTVLWIDTSALGAA